ncbi:MAG: purine-nucleoside phosphorylase [Deltaproteobacteria bacterium]|nr:purine-nucleoside phosphorylase [Deltaproteobacteria bacterium]
MKNEWKCIDEMAAELGRRFGEAPDVTIVLGSGLGAVADMLENRRTAQASEIPDWPVSTVEGHAGRLHVGAIDDVRVLLLQGRVHLYEGYRPAEVVRPTRAAVTWGARTVILTNAAGSVSANLTPGQLMVFEDHINLTGQNPLVGPPDESRGPRFPDLTSLYDSSLRGRAFESAARLGITLAEGIYAGVLGPTYETPAEARLIGQCGAHAVGMSTVHEAIAASHVGARVAAVSCITNRAAGFEGAVLDHEHVQRAGETASKDLARLLADMVATLGDKS